MMTERYDELDLMVYSLGDASPADQEKHIIARASFLNELRVDDDVNAMLHEAAAKAGLKEPLDRAVGLLQPVADRLGCTRGDIIQGRADLREHLTDEEVDKVDEAHDCIREFFERMEESNAVEVLAQEILEYVRGTLKIEWPWVAYELLDIELNEMVNYLHCVVTRQDFAIRPRPAPDNLELKFRTKAGESVDSALARLEREYNRVRDILVSATDSYQHPDEDKWQRNARWFYRHKVRGESVRSIARQYTEQSGRPPESDDRSTIQTALKETERILGLPPFRFKPSL